MFICRRCGYSTKYKGDLKKHLEKKKVCVVVNEDVSIDILIVELYAKEDNKYKCKCGKSYSHQSGLSAHKRNCKFEESKVDLSSMAREIEQLKEKIKELEEKPSVINNITTNNNDNKVINNTLVINDFGKENIDYITEAFVRTCLKQQDIGVIKLTEKIHFNDKHPENKNVNLPNKKEPYVQVVEKGKQILKPKKEVIDDLIINIGNILDEQLEYVTDELKKNWVKNERMAKELDRFMKQLFENDSDLRKRLTERVYLLLINNR